jgi:hypothetical protein
LAVKKSHIFGHKNNKKSKNDKEDKFETVFLYFLMFMATFIFLSGHMSTASDIMIIINCLLPRAAKMM